MYRKKYSKDPYWLVAKFGVCVECNKNIKGKRAFYYPATKNIFCETCGAKHSADFESHKFDEMIYNSWY